MSGVAVRRRSVFIPPRVALGRAPLRRSSLEMVHWTISFAFGETLLTHR
ncbi:MAG TPA: hypothetical protein VJP60_05220 [Rhizomicrobium sp.]|nr:hypothetical protein [Rhizomicrobium sp.]